MLTRLFSARPSLVALALAFSFAACDGGGAGQPVRLTPLADGIPIRVQISGTEVLRTPEAWQAFWTAHRGPYPNPTTETAPAVDFTRQVVVGVFYGGDVHGGCTHDIDVIRSAKLDARTLRVGLAPLPSLGPCRMVAHPLDIVVVDVAPDAFDGVRFTGPLP